MGILNQLFEISCSENTNKKLGNILISGAKNNGRKKFQDNLLKDLFEAKKLIFLVNGMLSDIEHGDLLNFVSSNIAEGAQSYDFNIGDSTSCVDILSAFENADQKTEFIKGLIASAGCSEKFITMAGRFYKCAIKALDALGKEYKLMDLSKLDIDAVVDLVESTDLPDTEKSRSFKFLEDDAMHASYFDIDNSMEELESAGLLRMFSGDLKISDLLLAGNVILLSGKISDNEKKKEQLFNAFFHAISKCLQKNIDEKEVSFFINDTDFIAGEYITDVLSLNSSYDCAAYVFIEDLRKYHETEINAIFDNSKSFLIFQQGSDENAKFWSAFFGHRDINKTTVTFTRQKGFFARLFSGGVVAQPMGDPDSKSVTLQKVNGPIYKPEVFRELKPNEVLIFLRDPLKRKKRTI